MFLRPPGLAMLCVTLVTLGGCATGRIDAQWRDSETTPPLVPGNRVYVVCEAAELTVRRICQDKLVAQVTTLGGVAVAGEMSDQAPARPAEAYLAAARGAGAQFIIVSVIRQNPAFVTERTGPSIGIGMGGSNGRFGTGVGFSFPFPGSGVSVSTTPSYGADTSISTVADGKLRWSAKASTVQDDVARQMQDLVKVTLEAARKGGVI